MIIYIFVSILNITSLFIILIYILKNINNKEIEKDKLISKLNSIDLNLKIVKENTNFYNKNINFYNIIYPMGVIGHKKIRIGGKADGGYIFLDDLKNIKYAYSFGISNEISFDKELADKNIDVYMYDHTIERLPFENSRFHWQKLGLAGKNTNKTNLKTLPELLKENRHSKEKNMILKMDIESNEWEVFENMPINILNQFKYIVAEFHFSRGKNINYFNILKKIQNTHQIFHLHCNNCGIIIDLYGYKICNLLEISFLQKSGYEFIKDNSIYPIEGLDFKNCRKKKEISGILNYFKTI